MFYRATINYFDILDTLEPLLIGEGWVIHDKGTVTNNSVDNADYIIAESPEGGCITLALDYSTQGLVFSVVGNVFPVYDNALDPFRQNDRSSLVRILVKGDFELITWVNSRRIIIVGNSSNRFHSLYLGSFLPYSPPSLHQYPLYASGAFSNGLKVSENYDDPIYDIDNIEHGVFSYGDTNVFQFNNEWSSTEAKHFPCEAMHNLGRCDSGNYPLYPVILHSITADGIATSHIGTLDGVNRTSGEYLRPMDVVLLEGREYTAIPNNMKMGVDDFFLIENT